MQAASSWDFDLVMFDLDGTLIETAAEISDAVNDTLAQQGLPTVTQGQVERWIGLGTHELLIQALAYAQHMPQDAVRQSASLPAVAAEFSRHYAQRCGTRSRLYPQVREVLQQLRQRQVRLAVVTNKEARYTQTILAAHGLPAWLDRVVSGDSLPTKKPDPAGIHSCLSQFRVRPERALFVGDSSIDVAAARRAGVPVWVLPYGYNMGQPIEDSQPDRVLADFSMLLKR